VRLGGLDHEEAVALDHQVVGGAGLLDRSASHVELGARDPHAETGGQPRREAVDRILRQVRLVHLDVEQVLEVRPASLEAVGVHVREVVRDDVEVGVQGVEARRGGVEGEVAHVVSLTRYG
jgi:hypothetical protein